MRMAEDARSKTNINSGKLLKARVHMNFLFDLLFKGPIPDSRVSLKLVTSILRKSNRSNPVIRERTYLKTDNLDLPKK